jgi:signal transduction histidine kinase
VESAAYFLVCEAVTNALKHAHASELTLSLAADDGHLRVRVSDDGRGFDTAAGVRHGGLLHMEDRVRSFGGDLRIESELGAGTSVLATFPVAPEIRSSSAAERTTPPPPDGSYLVPR